MPPAADRRLFLQLAAAALVGMCGGLGAAGVGAALLRIARPRLDTTPTPMPTLTPRLGALRVLTRADWDARPPDHSARNEYGFASTPLEDGWYVYPGDWAAAYRTLVVHHSAFPAEANETMRTIQDLHMDRNGWADIGYHFGIDKAGLLYQGRDLRVRGASVRGRNSGSLGVVVMGHFEREVPTEAQLTTLEQVVRALADAYPLTHLAGHNEFNEDTSCPGPNLAIYLDALAQTAGLTRGTGGYVTPA